MKSFDILSVAVHLCAFLASSQASLLIYDIPYVYHAYGYQSKVIIASSSPDLRSKDSDIFHAVCPDAGLNIQFTATGLLASYQAISSYYLKPGFDFRKSSKYGTPTLFSWDPADKNRQSFRMLSLQGEVTQGDFSTPKIVCALYTRQQTPIDIKPIITLFRNEIDPLFRTDHITAEYINKSDLGLPDDFLLICSKFKKTSHSIFLRSHFNLDMAMHDLPYLGFFALSGSHNRAMVWKSTQSHPALNFGEVSFHLHPQVLLVSEKGDKIAHISVTGCQLKYAYEKGRVFTIDLDHDDEDKVIEYEMIPRPRNSLCFYRGDPTKFHFPDQVKTKAILKAIRILYRREQGEVDPSKFMAPNEILFCGVLGQMTPLYSFSQAPPPASNFDEGIDFQKSNHSNTTAPVVPETATPQDYIVS